FSFCLIAILLAVLGLGLYPSHTAVAQSAQPSLPIHAQYRGLSPVVHFDISPPLREMRALPATQIELRENEDQEIVPMKFRFGLEPHSVLQSTLGPVQIPPAIVSFDGPPNLGGVAPPDPDGEVGPNHVVVMVNSNFQIFDKTGTSLFGPAAT